MFVGEMRRLPIDTPHDLDLPWVRDPQGSLKVVRIVDVRAATTGDEQRHRSETVRQTNSLRRDG